MKRSTHILPLVSMLALAMGVSTTATAQPELLEFDELKAIIEINATDGDVGFHALADAEALRYLRLDDPNGIILLGIRAHNNLMVQGLTENFFESAEPLCEQDEEEPDEPVTTLAEFLGRFPEGMYVFRANTNVEGDRIRGEAELTYNMPAAPDISATEDMVLPIDDALIMWGPGEDLGESCSDESLIDDGTIPDPAEVEVIGWEVVVEYDGDESPEPFRVFSAQLPPEQTSVTVPEEFLQPFVDAGFTEFKFEVGAIEESGNQTFSEGGFEIED